jgi:hypothetical protein
MEGTVAASWLKLPKPRGLVNPRRLTQPNHPPRVRRRARGAVHRSTLEVEGFAADGAGSAD